MQILLSIYKSGRGLIENLSGVLVEDYSKAGDRTYD